MPPLTASCWMCRARIPGREKSRTVCGWVNIKQSSRLQPRVKPFTIYNWRFAIWVEIASIFSRLGKTEEKAKDKGILWIDLNTPRSQLAWCEVLPEATMRKPTELRSPVRDAVNKTVSEPQAVTASTTIIFATDFLPRKLEDTKSKSA